MPAYTKRLVLIWLVPLLLLLAVVPGCRKQNLLSTVEAVPYLGLPASVNHLHCADMKRLRGTQFFQDMLEQAQKENGGFKSVYDGLRQQVGFDPVQDLDMVTLALRGKPQPNQPLSHVIVLARGRFTDMAGKLEKLRHWLGDEFLIQPPPFQTSRHEASDITINKMTARSQYNERIEFQILIAFPTENLMILAFSPEFMNDTLDVIASVKGVKGINNSPEWVEKLKTARISATMWGYGDFSVMPEQQQVLANIPDGQAFTKITNYFYDLDSDGDFRAALGFVCDSIDSATKLSATLDKGRKMLSDQLAASLPPEAAETIKLPTRLLVTTELKTSHLVLRLTAADIGKINAEIDKMGSANAPPRPQ
ncbi:MAG: hypothetical protein ABFD69_13840 [Candidatus Sumerlaeia bacterium]